MRNQLARLLTGLKHSAPANPACCALLLAAATALLAQAQTPFIKAGGVVGASAFGQFTSIAPGSWIEIYGSNLATNTRSWGGADFNGANAPTSLDGTKVMVGGQAAFVDYISPGQVNAQVPSNAGTGPQTIMVITPAGTSNAYPITVNPVEPGLLAPASFRSGAVQYVAALFSDNATYVLPPGLIPGVASKRAQPGDVITLYGVGFGPVTPNIPAGQVVGQSNSLTAPFSLLFGSTPATLPYYGLAPGAVGLYQFNAVVPAVPAGDTVQISFNVGGVQSTQALAIPIQAVPLPQIQSLTFSSTAVAGGGSLQGTVTLTGPAPPGGVVVTLMAGSSISVSIPAALTIPAGSTSGTFTITTPTVTSTQLVLVQATYGSSVVQATFSVQAPANTQFMTLSSGLTFQPVGFASGIVTMRLLPNAGNTSYTVTLNGGGPIFTNGTFAGETLTANQLQSNVTTPPYGLFLSPGASFYLISSASITFTLSPTQSVASTEFGNLTGTLSITGTPFPGGGTAVTLSGAISGSYNASR